MKLPFFLLSNIIVELGNKYCKYIYIYIYIYSIPRYINTWNFSRSAIVLCIMMKL